MRVCNEPGCTNWTETPKCAACTAGKRRRSDARRPNAAARGYGPRWQRFARRYLRDHPGCADCAGRATEAHHLDGLGPNGPRGYDPSNLLPLCKACHSRRTMTVEAAPRRS